MFRSNRRIVVTGGPGGGKSSLTQALRAEDPDARRWVPVPEGASMLIGAGLAPRTKAFQKAVVRLQMTLEDAIAAVLREDGGPAGRVMVCDRGTLDSLAYWRLGGWDDREFVDLTGMGLDEHLQRYDGVIHLQTTAIGAEAHYQRGRHAGRHECPEEAARIDALCAEAWQGHERFVSITNADRDWPSKLAAALDVLNHWIEDPTH